MKNGVNGITQIGKAAEWVYRFCFREAVTSKKESDAIAPLPANPIRRSGRSPALPYPPYEQRNYYYAQSLPLLFICILRLIFVCTLTRVRHRSSSIPEKSKIIDNGESIENQITLCRKYIERNILEAKHGEIFVYEDEGFSAKNLDHPQFRLMMHSVRKEPFDYTVSAGITLRTLPAAFRAPFFQYAKYTILRYSGSWQFRAV